MSDEQIGFGRLWEEIWYLNNQWWLSSIPGSWTAAGPGHQNCGPLQGSKTLQKSYDLCNPRFCLKMQPGVVAHQALLASLGSCWDSQHVLSSMAFCGLDHVSSDRSIPSSQRAYVSVSQKSVCQSREPFRLDTSKYWCLLEPTSNLLSKLLLQKSAEIWFLYPKFGLSVKVLSVNSQFLQLWLPNPQ